ncbi:MAG: DUF4190 domain-containing protein [Gemmataceae bacterium]|nr:DUF4190 domain-containing protein [Gemmataceae bacterium]
MPGDGLARALYPHCERKVGVRPDQFGKRLRCPGCRLAFTFVPEPDRPSADRDVVGYHPAADADEGAVVRRTGRGGGRTDWAKAKLTARFDRPRDLVFRAAVQLVRGGRCDVVSVDWANAHLRFSLALNPGEASEHDLFVFEGADDDSELELTSREPNEDGQFDPYYQAVAKEVGKYLMFAAPPPPPPAPAPLPPRRERDDYDDRPRYRPRRRFRRRDEGTSGLAIASFVCGLIALVIFCFWPLSVPLALLGIVFGAIAHNSGKAGRGFAVAGITLEIIAVALLVVLLAIGLSLDREDRERGRRFNQAPAGGPTRLANTHIPSPSA